MFNDEKRQNLKNRRFLPSLLETRGLHMTDAEVLAIAKELDGIAVVGNIESYAKITETLEKP